MDWLDPHLRKLVYSSVVAVVSICGQFTTVIMATEPNTATVGPVPAEPKAQWNVAETNALLDHLVSNKSEVGDGGFKPSTFTSAATALARANLLTAGPPKTNKRCRSKWNTGYTERSKTIAMSQELTGIIPEALESKEGLH
ncbi:hypothetical protein DFJ58DRAFT_848159 [Suillus subalutaceus]|uniref:uncharacterized protein n=1 Tax=Suillus subalutaceus TaxID=48586 RepID=UPI001B86A38B|nr:uncharacterized protein DFJ58DRAFT_848159 [Suillus subalutaceus]KAG1831692.1 hypothetical protein DFJ58DRAFT_848159 [Suillus subalutaceus]